MKGAPAPVDALVAQVVGQLALSPLRKEQVQVLLKLRLPPQLQPLDPPFVTFSGSYWSPGAHQIRCKSESTGKRHH